MGKLLFLVVISVVLMVDDTYAQQAKFGCSASICFTNTYSLNLIYREWNVCCASQACYQGTLSDGATYRDCCPQFCKQLDDKYGENACPCLKSGSDMFWDGTSWNPTPI